MVRLFTLARSNASLAPAERALLKLIEGRACAALVAALPILADALGHSAGGATAALLALVKYCKAYGDPPLTSLPPQP